uniref:Reverse transcriptase domain-containing protein n=1 Tax=Oryzias latipes TaxID=8090 RepID=A0A3P9ME72_ORYLA
PVFLNNLVYSFSHASLKAVFYQIQMHAGSLESLSASVGYRHLLWFRSCQTDRTEYVLMGGCKSRPLAVTCGVPQGSVLGPILLIIYMLPLGRVINNHGLSFHCYADDTQINIKTAPNSTAVLSHLTTCLEEINAWMKSNFLQLNSSKTEADSFLLNIPVHFRQSGLHCFLPSHQPRSRFDPQLNFNNHIKDLYKTSFHHPRNISKPGSLLSLPAAETLVHAFISSRLDYCNSLFSDIPNKNIKKKRQYIQKSAARILKGVNMNTSPPS